MKVTNRIFDLEAELTALLKREGGFVDHPDDRGGATRFGITASVARAAGYAGDMRDLPEAIARAIYRRRYWVEPRFDAVAEIAPAVAAELFDTGVNMGPGTAVAFLQRSLNALNRRGRDWADVSPTRAVDAATLDALRAALSRRAVDGATVLLKGATTLVVAPDGTVLGEGRAAVRDAARW